MNAPAKTVTAITSAKNVGERIPQDLYAQGSAMLERLISA